MLNKIIAQKKRELATWQPLECPVEVCTTDFKAELLSAALPVIAEFKAKSPSEGMIRSLKTFETHLKSYRQGGAAALSILTDALYFGGDYSLIQQAKHLTQLPILCKEFIIDKRQIIRARQMGADAVLLIVRILDDKQLLELYSAIIKCGMTPLVEVFDQHDIDRLRLIKPTLVGVNNRDLDSLKMSTPGSESIISSIRSVVEDEECMVLSLSGMKTPQEAADMLVHFDGALIGTALLRSEQPEQFLQETLALHLRRLAEC